MSSQGPSDGKQLPPDLQKLLAGNRVAILGGPATAVPNKNVRLCTNCYFNPQGQYCQRNPMDVTGVPQEVMQQVEVAPGKFENVKTMQIKFIPVPRPALPDYACGEHRFEDEMPANWRWTRKPASANS